MPEIVNGKVLVIREDDAVVAIFYEQFYDDILELINEGLLYAKHKGIVDPNMSIMQVQDKMFVPLTLEDYPKYEEFGLILNPKVDIVCPHCGTLNFIFADSAKSFCPKCKIYQEKSL